MKSGPRRVVRLALDLGVSPLAYYGMLLAGVPTVPALVGATVVAGIWLLVTIALDRRVDGLAAFMLGMYALMLVLAAATADPRVLLARDPVTSGLAGLVFLVSCPTATPATAYLARRLHGATLDDRALRRHRVQTAVLGAGLVAEAAVRLLLVSALPVDVVAGLSPAIEFVVLPVLVLWMVVYRRRGVAVAR
ncbi:MAG TPA: VC0807 family protein [Actinocatenispora sp.]